VLRAIPGAPPDLAALPVGCAFAPRCHLVGDACLHDDPPALTHPNGRMIRCVREASPA
jgi:peptide/nickel transport system ATP-binding protein